jgi:phosphatidylserine/phosphatidylglycerophosphate/cardiolipin synthase-like enzyme
MNPALTIIDAALKLAAKLPRDVIEQAAQIISAYEPSEARSRIADSIPHAQYRSLCLGFLHDWRTNASGICAQEVAMALRTAGSSESFRQTEPAVEMVWTGPRSENDNFRHTEQAILQVLNSAERRLLLVSYAVYSIANIQNAVVRAAERGVIITVVVETPDRLGVQNEYSTLQALGEDVARCSKVYYWPKENRPKCDNGKVGVLHVKCAVADGERMFLSSANFTEYAFSINMELGLLLTGGKLPGQVERHFQQLIDDGELLPV